MLHDYYFGKLKTDKNEYVLYYRDIFYIMLCIMYTVGFDTLNKNIRLER